MRIKKWVKAHRKMFVHEERHRMSNPFADFFFLDAVDDARDYISVSVGDVWLYFYKENLIGVRDMRTSKAAYLDPPVEPPKPDHYSHRHELFAGTIDGIRQEAYVDAEPPKTLAAEDLTSLALQWVADSIASQINIALRIKP